MRSFVRPAAVAAVGLLAAASSARAVVTYTDLYTLGNQPAGFSFVIPFGPASATRGGQIVGSATNTPGTPGNNHAILWSAATPNGIDLTPGGFNRSAGLATDGTRQAGAVSGTATGNQWHATVWSGTPNSYVDLHPAGGLTSSFVSGINGTRQVGYGFTAGGNRQALLWSGAAANAVNLAPGGLFTDTEATAVSGTRQVGYGYGPRTGDYDHALLWSGTAASVVDLHPAGFLLSTANGVGGSQQVGYGRSTATNADNHALLWTGTAASVLDLNPGGFYESYANATDGTQQVGFGHKTGGGGSTALLWSGTAGSVVDLGALLPATFTMSVATSVSNGIVYGWAYDTNDHYHAIAWSIPEPTALAGLGVGGVLLLRRRHTGVR